MTVKLKKIMEAVATIHYYGSSVPMEDREKLGKLFAWLFEEATVDIPKEVIKYLDVLYAREVDGF